MRVKELKKTVNVCWSPAETYPTLLAAGSAAQQVDASFSSTSTLELYALNLEDPGYDLELKASLPTKHKFQKLVWSGAGNGIIVGGCDGGLIEFYNADKVLKNSPDALLGSSSKHNGQVSALDINPYQKNLLASGASESEIFIWDLNNTSQPMAPGNRSQPPEHVQGVAWNHQVQHILGSTFPTRCVVWDLRKNEPIMKLSDSVSRSRWRALCWHPSVATQLCIASEDDQVPVVQLWDLRLAASPLVTLEGHHKGVMSLSWCKQDPDLMLSAGKDGRVLCWNPNNTKPGGELLLEVCEHQQWVYDVSWCPRNPAVLVSSSFDQLVSVHSLFGRTAPESSSHTQSNIMDSFGGVDSFSQLPLVQREPQAHTSVAPQLPTPPTWLRRPTRASFAFGGKLVTFEKCPQGAGTQKLVYISQVVSEPEIVERAAELDTVLGASISLDPGASERLAEYCRQKADACSDQSERFSWYFLRANFMPTFRSEVLNLLGFKQDEIPSKFKATNAIGDSTNPDAVLSRGESTETEAELSTDTSTDLSDAHTLIERKLANIDLSNSVASNVVIPNSDDTVSTICRALVCGNLEEAVELCLEANRIADALIISSLGSQELLSKVQKYHLNKSQCDPVSLISGSLLHSNWDSLVQCSAPASWRHTLAALVTHCDNAALQHYCEMLATKLSSEPSKQYQEAALLCYLCGMSADGAVSVWRTRIHTQRDARSLADLTERALLAQRAAATRGVHMQSLGKLEAVLTEYASRLASQGCLQSALNILEGIEDTDLRQRLVAALRLAQPRRASQAVPQQQYVRTRTTSGQSHSQRRHNHIQHNDNGNNVYAGVDPQSAWGSSSVAASSFQTQPHRPPSAGPSAGVISSRGKYKVDPSVQSAPQYGQYGYTTNTQHHDTMGPAGVTAAGVMHGNQPAYPGNQILNPGMNQPFNPLMNQPLNPSLNQPLNPSLNQPLNPSLNQPLNPSLNQPLNPSLNQPLNPVNGNYYQQTAANIEPIAPSKPVAPGWNDPPMPTKPKPKQEVQAQAPITHPLFGVEPPQHVPLNAAQYPGQQYTGQYPGQQQQYPDMSQQYPGQQYPGQYPPPMQGGYTQPTELASEPVPAVPPVPVPVQKPPVPEPHANIQRAFDTLRAHTAERAANTQMKRKLEDVQKRLETLYDLLRDYRLSEAGLATLHQCAEQAQCGEYGVATTLATSLASGADFASAASFLPGLKVLFQLAQQLQQYAR